MSDDTKRGAAGSPGATATPPPTRAWSLKTLLDQCDNQRERSLVRDAYESGRFDAGAAPETRGDRLEEALRKIRDNYGQCAVEGGCGWDPCSFCIADRALAGL